MTKPDPAAVDAAVRETLKTWRVPGAAVAVVRDGEVVYLKGHGVREAGGDRSVTPDTVFPLASCTKAFTTTILAMLVDEEKCRGTTRCASTSTGSTFPTRSPTAK